MTIQPIDGSVDLYALGYRPAKAEKRFQASGSEETERKNPSGPYDPKRLGTMTKSALILLVLQLAGKLRRIKEAVDF